MQQVGPTWIKQPQSRSAAFAEMPAGGALRSVRQPCLVNGYTLLAFHLERIRDRTEVVAKPPLPAVFRQIEQQQRM